MNAADDLARANLPWDGRWRVQRPDDYTPGLYAWHQVIAWDLLRHGVGRLAEADARLLQVIAYQWRRLSPMQSHLLRKIDHDQGRIAA
jgi:hypothetical protein